MDVGCGKLITTDESAVIPKSILDAIVVKDSESDVRFPNSPDTNESNGFQVFSESNNPLD